MALDKAMESLKFDSRMEEWNLRNGKISKEDMDKHLASLEDCSANAQNVNIDERGSRTEIESEPQTPSFN